MRVVKIITSVLAVWFLVVSVNIHAAAIANSNLSYIDLQITADSGSVDLLIDWELDAFAESRNSLGEIDQDFDFSFFGGSVAADAAVNWASGHGDANAPDIFPPDFGVSATGSSAVDLPACNPKWANSLGRGTLVNGFSISGGVGSVNVDFSASLEGALEVWTDECGILAETEVIFSFEIFDMLPEINGTSQDQSIFSYHESLQVGSNAHEELLISESLSASRMLDYDTEYFFVIEVDSESSAIVPEPPIVALILFALVAILHQRYSYHKN